MADVTEHWKKLTTELVLKGATSVYVGLATSAFTPDVVPVVGEITGTGYVRQPASFTDFDANMTNDAVLLWSVGGTWDTIAYVFISESSQGGNALLHDSITSISGLTAGDVVKIPVGDLELT